MIALVFMGFFQGFIQAAIFSGVAGDDFVPGDAKYDATIATNMLGLAFLIGSDQFITMSFAQVLQIPVQRPIFMREVANRMYTTTAYYLASCAAATVTFFLYPMMTALVSFFFFDLDDSSFSAFLIWMSILVLTAFTGSFWGQMFGTFMKNEVAAVQLNMLFLILFSFGGGFYANTGEGQNPFVRIISLISPMRYSAELLMRQELKEKPGSEYVLEGIGYTWGNFACCMLLLSFSIVTFLIGWIALVAKTSQKE